MFIPFNMIYYIFIYYHLFHFHFYYLLPFITPLLHHLLQYAIWEYLLPFIPFMTNGVLHL